MTPLTKTPILLAALCFTGCLAGRLQSYTKADEPLFTVLRELNKHPGNSQALKDLPALYNEAVARHEKKIYSLSFSDHYGKFDHMAYEEEALEHINDAIRSIPAAFAIIKPRDIRYAAGATDYYRSEIDYYWWNMYQEKLQECKTDY